MLEQTRSIKPHFGRGRKSLAHKSCEWGCISGNKVLRTAGSPALTRPGSAPDHDAFLLQEDKRILSLTTKTRKAAWRTDHPGSAKTPEHPSSNQTARLFFFGGEVVENLASSGLRLDAGVEAPTSTSARRRPLQQSDGPALVQQPPVACQRWRRKQRPRLPVVGKKALKLVPASPLHDRAFPSSAPCFCVSLSLTSTCPPNSPTLAPSAATHSHFPPRSPRRHPFRHR